MRCERVVDTIVDAGTELIEDGERAEEVVEVDIHEPVEIGDL